MQGNDDRKKILAIMIAVVGIVLLLVSFILPWWGLHQEMEGIGSIGGFGVSISSGISYRGSGTGFYIGTSTSIIYSTAAILIILALICASLMVTALTISLINNNIKPKLPCASLMVTALTISLINNNIKPKLPFQLGVLALMFCLLAPIIFMIALPMAMKADAEKEAEDQGEEYNEPDGDSPHKSFFGSYEVEGIGHKSYWGGDIGWFLSFISFLFLAISVNMLRPRRITPSPPLAQPVSPTSPVTQPPHQVRYSLPPPPPPRSK
jgi:hypothetical protein